MRDVARVGLAALVAFAAVIAYASYRIWDQGRHDERRPVDAIVVLGAAQYDGRPSPVFAARLDHAVQLYGAGLARYLVVTGGKAQGDRTTEAAVARRYALAHGVPAAAIIGEDRGRTTVESLENVRDLFDAHGIHSGLFVSDPTHMLRVLRIAKDLGIEAWGSPTPTSPVEADTGRRAEAMVHELGSLGLYFVAGLAPPGESTVEDGPRP